MTEEELDAAIERITTAASREAEPERMTQAEAVAFYDAIAADAVMWSQTITAEMS